MQTVLAAVCLAYRPLTLDELDDYKFTPSARSSRIVDHCGSFLTIMDKTVHIVDRSAADYLIADTDADSVGIAEGHADITRRSIVMSSTLRDVYGIKNPKMESKNAKPPYPNPLASAAYSCEFWLEHLYDAAWSPTAAGGDICGNMSLTFKCHFLHGLRA
jgi:hypothetical protein